MSTSPLKRILDRIKISTSDSKCLHEKYGITTVQEFINFRSTLALSHIISKTCRLLVACIDYITERSNSSSTRYEESEEYKYFARGTPVSNCWEHFLALQYDGERNKMESVEEDVIQKSTSMGDNQGRNGRDEKGFRVGDQYWLDLTLQQDKSTVSSLPEIEVSFDHSSLWSVSDDKKEVFLKTMTDTMRIPLPLFKTLYGYQRDGIAWMADLFERGTGGILGE